MERLVIAVITAVIVVIGAVVTFTLFSRRKNAKKAPFKKTYSTGSAQELVSEATSLQTGTELSQVSTHSNQIPKKETQPKSKVAPKSSTKKPFATTQPPSMMSETRGVKSTPVQVVSPPITPKSSQVAETVAKNSDQTVETKPEASQTVAEITEVKAKPIEEKADIAPEKLPPKFITEIESELSPLNDRTEITQTEAKKVPEKIKSPKAPLQRSQDEQIAELLNFGTLNDWVTITKTPLSPDNFQLAYNKIVKLTYPRRKESKMRAVFRFHANKYVDTFKIKSQADTVSENIYKCLAIVLQEDQEFEKALGLCQKAMQLGLDDGTKTGYPGRMERLKKAQSKKKNKKKSQM
jgi:hypothetical protein